MNDGKPNWKRAGIFAALAVVILIVSAVLIKGIHSGNEEAEEPTSTQQEEAVVAESETTTEPENLKIEPQSDAEQEDKDLTEPEETNAPSDSSEATEEVPHRDGIYGISDKDVHDIDGTFSRNKVRNDVTGNWKISTIAADVQMVDYALSYYEWYIHSDSEVHAVVNFTVNTTTCIQSYGSQIYVTVHEYVDGEEHDANLLFSGDVLADYIVYTDNGDIEQIQ